MANYTRALADARLKSALSASAVTSVSRSAFGSALSGYAGSGRGSANPNLRAAPYVPATARPKPRNAAYYRPRGGVPATYYEYVPVPSTLS